MQKDMLIVVKRLSFALACAAMVGGCADMRRAEERAKPAPGLTARDGRLYKDGAVYRAIGVNYCDLFQDMISSPDEQRTLKGLRFLEQKKVPFVRFWACGFWPSDWDLYFANKNEWFRRLDLVVKTAEESGVGLIPDLFWRTDTYPGLCNEYVDQWANPESKTRRFMATYVREVVTRYAGSPAIWGWEFSNETNLGCNLPNGMNFLGVKIPHLKVNVEKNERNLLTYEIAKAAFIAFAQEVRKYDPHRFITTGNSCPRECSWHNAKEKSWTKDNLEQAFDVFQWMSPPPMDVVSAHFYPKCGEPPTYAEASGIDGVLARWREFSDRIGQSLFVGEFGPSEPKKGEPPLAMEQFRSVQTQILDALVRQKADLAAFWVFDYTKDRKGQGLVRADNEYAWVLDQIVEYNEKIAKQLVQETQK